MFYCLHFKCKLNHKKNEEILAIYWFYAIFCISGHLECLTGSTNSLYNLGPFHVKFCFREEILF